MKTKTVPIRNDRLTNKYGTSVRTKEWRWGGGVFARFIPETGTNGDFPFEQQMHPVNLSLLLCSNDYGFVLFIDFTPSLCLNKATVIFN